MHTALIYKYICFHVFLEYQTIDLESGCSIKNDCANTSGMKIYKMHFYKEHFTLLFKTWLLSSISD